MPLLRSYVLTTQPNVLTEKWFSGSEVVRFRRLVNYQTRDRFLSFVSRRISLPGLNGLAAKGFALADLLASIWNLFRIAWLIRRHKVQLIHLNNGFVPPEGLVAARLLRVPCLVYLQGFYRPESGRWRNLESYASMVLGDSDTVSESARQAPVPDERIRTLYPAVDLTAFDGDAPKKARAVRTQHGIETDDVAVGIFGRVIPWKGQDVFVEALLRAMDRDSRLRAFIIGDESDGSSQFFDTVRERVRRSPHCDRFTFTGFVDEVEAYYHAMDIVVHASVEPEPFGMVITEGMAARKAVIASDLGGPKEIIDHGKDGLLVPPGDPEKLATSILHLAESSTLRDRMGRAGYEKVRTRFDVPILARQLSGIYQSVRSGTQER